MQTLPKDPVVLPDTAQLREKLAEIIARVCQCEPEPLLQDQDFSAVVAQFDSLAVLEILLEIETAYGIETDEMLPVNQEEGAEELLSAFPKNLSELVVYMHETVARRPQREAELQARALKAGLLREGDGPKDASTEASRAPDDAASVERTNTPDDVLPTTSDDSLPVASTTTPAGGPKP